MTHFEVFGLPASPDLDVKALEQRHRDLSLQVHPDRVRPADARTRRTALEQTTMLNDAFQVLRDPARRASYLLKLNGIDLGADAEASRRALPLEFLEEVMERREQLEQLKARRDLPGVQALGERMRSHGAAALDRAQGLLREANYEGAAAWLVRVKYYARFLDEVGAMDDEQRS
jgi:molecular chaperone HscB